MKILSVGPLFAHNRNNTTAHRSDCLSKHADEYFEELDSCLEQDLWLRIITKLSYYGLKFNIPDNTNVNKRLIEAVKSHPFDLVWIDKGNMIYPETLKKIKSIQPNCLLVHYMIDDFMNPFHKTKQIMNTIPLYDFYIVNRAENVEELKKYGCKKPVCVFRSYEDTFYYPRPLTEEDKQKLGGDVGFIGRYEKARAKSICYLADNGLTVRVWGEKKWSVLKNYSPNLIIEGTGLYGEDYCKAIGAFKINLGFLCKTNRDLHTLRSLEIPACGGFMLAERTSEHQILFEEGKEADFFSQDEELLAKCLYFLENEEKRKTIATNGFKRCIVSKYSNKEMMKKVLGIIFK